MFWGLAHSDAGPAESYRVDMKAPVGHPELQGGYKAVLRCSPRGQR